MRGGMRGELGDSEASTAPNEASAAAEVQGAVEASKEALKPRVSRLEGKLVDEVVDAACHWAATETGCWKLKPHRAAAETGCWKVVKVAVETHDDDRVSVASSFRGKAVHEVIASGGESEVSMAWSRGQF